jgi:hypothetical protein
MNYIEDLGRKIFECTGDIKYDQDLYSIYALLALSTGINTTNENVHDAWSVWATQLCMNHKSLIPYDELPPDIQDLDTQYRNAIQKVALLFLSKEPVSIDPETQDSAKQEVFNEWQSAYPNVNTNYRTMLEIGRLYELKNMQNLINQTIQEVSSQLQNRPDDILVEDFGQLKIDFRQAPNVPNDHIVSVGIGRDGSKKYLRVCVDADCPIDNIPMEFRGLPVLVRGVETDDSATIREFLD